VQSCPIAEILLALQIRRLRAAQAFGPYRSRRQIGSNGGEEESAATILRATVRERSDRFDAYPFSALSRSFPSNWFEIAARAISSQNSR
jgi:hypothetical protein